MDGIFESPYAPLHIDIVDVRDDVTRQKPARELRKPPLCQLGNDLAALLFVWVDGEQDAEGGAPEECDDVMTSSI